METLINSKIKDFKVQAYHNDDFKEVSQSDLEGKWSIFFFYPADFTFVCPTEIIAFSNKAKEFREIGCEVVGVSVDSQFSHMEYCLKSRKDGGLGEM